MPKYGLTERQRKNYYSTESRKKPRKRIDFVKVCIYSLTGQLLKQQDYPISEFVNNDQYVEFSGQLNLNLGKHVRELGYRSGDYRIEYKFLKRLVGHPEETQVYGLDYSIPDNQGGIMREYYLDRGEVETRIIFPDTPQEEIKYYLVEYEGVDLSNEPVELILAKKTIQIDSISPDRTELIIEPNSSLYEFAGNSDVFQSLNSVAHQLRQIDKGTFFIPLKGVESKEDDRIVFVTQQGKETDEDYILQIPEYSTFEGFDDTMVGNEIVFENFFTSYIPNHYKGEYIPDDRRKFVRNSGITIDDNIKYDLTKYDIPSSVTQSIDEGATPWFNIPFMNINPEINVNRFALSNPTNRLQENGVFTRFIEKDNLSSLPFLPSLIWQTNDTGDKLNSEEEFHYPFAGTFPYQYNKSDDTDNVDWAGTLVNGSGLAGFENSGLSSSFEGGYRVNILNTVYTSNPTNVIRSGGNLAISHLDWVSEITEVLDERTIKISKQRSIKEQYYKLRELGFKIFRIGNQDYNPGSITNLDFSKLYCENFYVKDEKQDIQEFTTYLQTSNNFYLVTNFKKYSEQNGGQYAVKLQQPLRPDIYSIEDTTNPKTHFQLVREEINDYEDRVSLVPKQQVNDTFLYPANFDGSSTEIIQRPTEFKSHNTLLGSDDEQNRQLENLLVSGSLLDVKLNIDYQKRTTDPVTDVDDTGFGNFVFFSNAESRLRNFRKKLKLIEDYTTESASLVSITNGSGDLEKVVKKRQRVKDSFSPYEHFLYYESSSYQSSSLGEFHDTSWPKTNSSKPYTLASTGSATAITWFDNMILSASSYDYNNPNSLRNTLPDHVNQDSQNNVFLEFMDMVGEQFDETWSYIKSLTDINFRVNNVAEGISKDITKHYGEALGIKLFNGNDLVDISEYLLGENTDGSSKNETAGEALTEEIWKRILANLPFFMKTKGTERALKGIINCYGIPSSILRVREYGGPDKGTRVSYEIKRKFTRALDFRGSQYIKNSWENVNSLKPQTIEFRFRTPSQSNQTILHKDDLFAIQLINSESTEYGDLRFTLSGSQGYQYLDTPKYKFFNNEMWSVMLTRKLATGAQITDDTSTNEFEYELTAKQYDSTRQRIIFSTSASIDIDGSVSQSYNQSFRQTGNIVLGNSGSYWTGTFSGSLMEFRLWNEPLSESVFDNHVRTPKAYNGNTTESSYNAVLYRLPLDDNRNLQTNPTASTVQYLTTYDNYSGVSGSDVNGFTGNFYRTLVDQEKMKVPNVAIRRNATKIRLENNSKPATSTLNRMHSVETSPQDEAPIDTNKLGVYFSPTDVINEDIIYSVADFNFDDLIGDPRDEFENNYRGLRGLRHTYFKRYTGKRNNFFDYLRILNFYDDSIFQVLKQFVPARAQATFGNLIEPNILERNKQFKRKPQQTQPYFENADDFEQGIRVSHFISGSNNNTIRPFGEFPYHEGTLNYYSDPIYRGLVYNTLVHINEINPRDIDSVTYATGSVTKGETEVEFRETVQPNLMNNRISLYNKVRKFYYTSSLSVATANGYGHIPANVDGLYRWSSSLEPTDVQAWYQDTISERLFFKGTQLRSSTAVSTDGTFDESDSPVLITFTNPTKLTTQQPGESRLKTD
jgi:hypothetical protein